MFPTEVRYQVHRCFCHLQKSPAVLSVQALPFSHVMFYSRELHSQECLQLSLRTQMTGMITGCRVSVSYLPKQRPAYGTKTSCKVEDQPERYPQLASFVNLDINTKIYRRFSYLRSPLLLNHQVSLTFLKQQLSKLDKYDGVHNPNLVYSIKYDCASDGNPTRMALLKDIQNELKEYDDLLLREQGISSIKPASHQAHRIFFDWCWNEQALQKDELSFIFHKDDLAAIGYNE